MASEPIPEPNNAPPSLTPKQLLIRAAMLAYTYGEYPAEGLLNVLAVGEGIRPGAILTVKNEIVNDLLKTLRSIDILVLKYPVQPPTGGLTNLLLLKKSRENLRLNFIKISTQKNNVNARNTRTGKVLGYVTPSPLSAVSGPSTASGGITIILKTPTGEETTTFVGQKIIGDPETHRVSFEALKDALLAMALPDGFSIKSAKVTLTPATGGSRKRSTRRNRSKRSCSRRSKKN